MNLRNVVKKMVMLIVVIIMIGLTIASAKASPSKLELTPSSLDILLHVNRSHYVPVTLKNPSPETIYNIKFTGASQYMTVPDEFPFLNPNESVTLNFRFFSASELGETNLVSVLSFNYLLEVSQQVTTYTVYIGDTGFSANSITIYEGDSVEFVNNGTTYHTVTELPISPNGIDRNLSNTGDRYELVPQQSYEFFDRKTGTLFKLNVVNRDPSSLVHSSTYDSSLQIRLRAILEPVTLNIELLTPEHNVRYNETAQGVIKLSNPNNAAAQNVTLKSVNGISGSSDRLFRLEEYSSDGRLGMDRLNLDPANASASHSDLQHGCQQPSCNLWRVF